ncbi:unnamed protein product, partial [Coregonus sp. 'balchen']
DFDEPQPNQSNPLVPDCIHGNQSTSVPEMVPRSLDYFSDFLRLRGKLERVPAIILKVRGQVLRQENLNNRRRITQLRTHTVAESVERSSLPSII